MTDSKKPPTDDDFELGPSGAKAPSSTLAGTPTAPNNSTDTVVLGPPGGSDAAIRPPGTDAGHVPSGGGAATMVLGPKTEDAPPAKGGTLVLGAKTEAIPPGDKKGTLVLGKDDDEYAAYIGKDLAGYTIQRKLAEGGMGVVFEGLHGKIGRRGAIKVLKLEFCRSNEIVERFHQEARAVNAIRHENIVDIYEIGRDGDGRAFFVMEYLEGEPLSGRIARGAIKWSEAFPILEQTFRALKAAHDKGFVHRDLKPDNIWLKSVEGAVQVKLLDFGIAKLIGSEGPKEKLTRTGSVIGTPDYMSPEQINGSKDIDHRSDIYAMGVIMYEMFSGVTPFAGDTLQAVMTGHLFKEPPRLANVPRDLGVPLPIAQIIDRMLVKEASARYASVEDVLSDLRDVNTQRQPAKAQTLDRVSPARKTEVTPVATAPASAPASSPRSNKGLIAAVAGVGLLAAGGVVAWQLTKKQPTQPAVVAQPAPAPVPAPTPPKPEPPPAPVLDYDALRKDAHTTLRNSLAEAEPIARVQGSDALGKIKDQPSVPTLTKLTESDPDPEVRGHSADALGVLGATDAMPLLAKLEKAAPPALKVWYASALGRLGDKAAKKRVYDYAKDPDLKVAFKAGLSLADISEPGDKDAIKRLRSLAAKEAELNTIAAYAGAILLTKLAALRDPEARKILYSILEARDEGAQLAAAEGLAKLGDDGGKKVLESVLANEASPNRLVGAVALIPLGEYAGFDFITTKLDDKDLETRRLAARALGDIGEPKSLPALIAMLTDKSWPVRIAAAGAIVAIVGLDPQVLAQASVDWTKSALGSQDWAVRQAAAGVLGDMPERDAVPLLAQAIADPEPRVRVAASRSARKMKGNSEAATQIASATKIEKDPMVKEEQVKALGEIGSPVARDTLAAISNEPGRIGVFAAGSLIAVGDVSGKDKLDAAVLDKKTEMRLAAAESASAANNSIVVTTLKTAVADKDFTVRFAAAEGLSRYVAEKAFAVPVLEMALATKDPSIHGRALSALLVFGEKPKAGNTPGEMLDSADPRVRLAAVPVVRVMPGIEGVPYLRRIVADSQQEVRRTGVDAIAVLAKTDKAQAIKLYKPLVDDADAVVRAKVRGQLSRLVPPPPGGTKTAQAPVVPAPPAVDPMLQVTAAAQAATTAVNELKAAVAALEANAAEIEKATAQPASDDALVARVGKLASSVDQTLATIDATAAKADAAAKAVADAAGPSPDAAAAKLVTDAQAAAKAARDLVGPAKTKADAAAKAARDFAKAETTDVTMFLAAADAALASGNLDDAKRALDKAAAQLRAAGTKNAGLEYSYGQLYDKQAGREADPVKKKALLEKALQSYQRFAKAGTGARVKRANERASEIADEIKELATP